MITKTTASPFKKSGGDIVPLDTDAKLGIGLSSPVGMLDIDTGSGAFTVVEATVADDASLALETILPGNQGILSVVSTNQTLRRGAGVVFIQGDDDGIYKIDDPTGFLSISGSTTTDNLFYIYPDGDSTYTLTNRLGSEKTFVFTYLGAD
tara:strand:- start:95 stop:544 length:450 start_codon:yes stop_codon:yes gene_type:complete